VKKLIILAAFLFSTGPILAAEQGCRVNAFVGKVKYEQYWELSTGTPEAYLSCKESCSETFTKYSNDRQFRRVECTFDGVELSKSKWARNTDQLRNTLCKIYTGDGDGVITKVYPKQADCQHTCAHMCDTLFKNDKCHCTYGGKKVE